jgi:hypothetical protein
MESPFAYLCEQRERNGRFAQSGGYPTPNLWFSSNSLLMTVHEKKKQPCRAVEGGIGGDPEGL